MKPTTGIASLLIVAVALAGCANSLKPPPTIETYESMGYTGRDPTGTNPAAWPDLHGATVTVLSHGAFAGFEAAAELFHALTNGTAVEIKAADAGDAANIVMRDAGKPSADVVYGLDNILLYQVTHGLDGNADPEALEPYLPLLWCRIDPALTQGFFLEDTRDYGAQVADGDCDPNTARAPAERWPATPMDHAYVAVNVDHDRLEDLGHITQNRRLSRLADVRDHADQFVVSDPRQSSPGAAFLLVTVAAFGTDPAQYDWKDYWNDLFKGRDTDGDRVRDKGVLVVPKWADAYEEHFSGGYGPGIGGKGDRALVLSYIESPAFEWYYDFVAPHANSTYDQAKSHYKGDLSRLPGIILEANSTWHQIQTMAILKGTDNLPAAQAWIEFALTDAYQELSAPYNAVRPGVASVDTSPIFQGLLPSEDQVRPAYIPYSELDNLYEDGGWLDQWIALCEQNNCA